MWMPSPAQRAAMRLGAIMMLIAVPILAVVAVATFPDTSSDEQITWVDDGESEFTLPDPGLFGGSSTVYGSTTAGPGADRPSPADLGCRLLRENGDELSSAKLNALAVVSKPAISVDDTEVTPLFEVSYDRGDRVACEDLDRVAPVAYTSPSTFGSSEGMVFIVALTTAFLCLVLGSIGVVVLRPRRA